MENITIKDIVAVTKGKLLCGDEKKEIKKFSIDSRVGDEDSLFVPIIGENVDAHKFLLDAIQLNGAALTSEHDRMDLDKPVIRVEDTLKAMQEIGTFYRNKMDLPVVAVTGSVGKTTTREMIAHVLSSSLEVFQTPGNQNSQIGVPLTLSQMKKEDEVAVLEIGMSERGQIERLTTMIRPNIAVVTVIGVSHIEQLKTQENICQEKMDITKGLKEGGMIFLNGDDPFLAKYRGNLKETAWFYGMGKDCDYRAENIQIVDGQSKFDFVCRGKQYEATLNMIGNHNIQNALAALGIADQMGIDMENAIKSLESFHGQRQQITKFENFTMIDDTYNASPDSMKAATTVLASLDGTGKKIAVLADMLELGEKEKQFHFEVGAFIAKKPIDMVIAYGELAPYLVEAIKESERKDEITCILCKDREEVFEQIKKNLSDGDIILLKGSNGMKLKEVANRIKEELAK